WAPLCYANIHKKTECVRLLLARPHLNYDVTWPQSPPAWIYCVFGPKTVEIAQLVLEREDIDLNKKIDHHNWAALHFAAHIRLDWEGRYRRRGRHLAYLAAKEDKIEILK